MAQPRRRYQTLDGLRGIAALAVVLHHSSAWFPHRPHLAESAVDLFFLISGFVLAAAYGERLGQGLDAKEFMRVRLIRLYPLYLAGLLIAIAGLVISLVTNNGLTPFHAAFWQAVPFAALMLPSPGFGVMGNIYPLNPPAWSLFYELLVNLVFAATFRFWTTRTILVVAALCGLWMLGNPAVLSGGWSHLNAFDGIFRVGFFFPLGVLLFRLEGRLPRPGWLRPWHCLVVFALFVWADPGPFSALLILLGYPLLVALAAGVEPSGLWARACDKLGQWSYAVYAVHFPIISLAAAAEAKLGLHFAPLAVGGALLVGLLVLSELLDRYYDAPVRRWLMRRR